MTVAPASAPYAGKRAGPRVCACRLLRCRDPTPPDQPQFLAEGERPEAGGGSCKTLPPAVTTDNRQTHDSQAHMRFRDDDDGAPVCLRERTAGIDWLRYRVVDGRAIGPV